MVEKMQPLEADAAARRLEFTARARALLAVRYSSPPLAHVHSFGCQQNLSDGEKLCGMLAELGYGFTDSPENADLVLYNTCAIRENAEDRALGNVGALKPLKLLRPGMLVGLCGCMMQQQGASERIKRSYPHVDIVFGTHAIDRLPELLYNRISGENRQFSTADSDGAIIEGLPLRRSGSIKANLPIMYGCDNFCTYCIVPYVRGRERSRRPADILTEARALIAEGFREITLLGQNVNSYGKGTGTDFPALLREINALDGDFVIRFMTSHPKDCTPALLDAVADCEKVCRHIHLPVQSGSDRVLDAMNRRYTVAHYLELIAYARQKIPGVGFSSDIIVGFPGESDAEFRETLALVRQIRYNAIYTFIYSPREGTKAALLDDPVTGKEKSTRMNELLAAQRVIRDELQQAFVGKTLRVLADGAGKTGEGWLCGRTACNDIVEFRAPKALLGSFVQVRIDRALNWALFGEAI